MQVPELLAASLLDEARQRTLDLVAPVGDPDVERVTNPIMSPLAWDLAHIAAYEDLWLAHRHGGLPLLRPELAAMYGAFETPRAGRRGGPPPPPAGPPRRRPGLAPLSDACEPPGPARAPLPLLDRAQAEQYLADV